jgi:hypothetical protein
MNRPASNLEPIFAVPLGTARIPQPDRLNLDLAAGLAPLATDAQRDKAFPADPFCFRSREEVFEWQGEPLSYLKREMLAATCETALAASSYTDEQFNALGIQARARFVVVRPNGALSLTALALASWCTVYCVAAPDVNPERPDSATLRLYSHRFGGMFLDAANWDMREPYHYGHHTWLPIPGDMAIFPAYLPHEVALNRGDRDLMLVVARVRFAEPGAERMPPW